MTSHVRVKPMANDLDQIEPHRLEGESTAVAIGRMAAMESFKRDVLADPRFDALDSGTVTRMRGYLLAVVAEIYFTRAIARVGITRAAVSQWRQKYVWFRALEDQARECYLDILEAEVDRRAFAGYDRPIYYKGKEEGKERVYSDILALARLKALAPDRYAERKKTELSGPEGGPIRIQPIVEQLREKLLAQAARHQEEQKRKELPADAT